MAPQPEALGDGARRGEKAVGLPWRFEPLHLPLPLAGKYPRGDLNSRHRD